MSSAFSFPRIFEKTPVFLAPMAGVTDAPFREIVMSFGATAVVSEMVSSEALIRNSQKTYRRLHSNMKNVLKIVQIMGANPINMAESAKINEQLGADVIDINMGCPARKIVSNESGSALMRDENLAVEIAKTVVNAVGIQMLTIHCRTRNQMYSGIADWSAIAKMRETVKIPYLCNGDIKSIADAEKALELSRANGVMIGRGALGRPWLLKQVMEGLQEGAVYTEMPSLQQQYEIIMRHFQATLDFYGEYHGLRVFRKHFCWYSSGLSGASGFRETINRVENVALAKEYVCKFYENLFLK